MMFRPVVLAFLAAAFLVAAPSLSGAAVLAASFGGARLGITVGEWRSLPLPDGAGPQAVPACSRDEAVVRVKGNPLTATDAGDGQETCAYVSLFGDAVLLHSVSFDAAYRASDLRYVFDEGRLAEIRFDASIDAYDDVRAALGRQFGPPATTRFDRVRTPEGWLQRVRLTWPAPGGAVTLVDPVPPFTELEVRLAPRGAPAAGALAASGAGAGADHHDGS